MRSDISHIIPKDCSYNCGTRIYWNTLENAYFEVFSGNRQQCPNRSQSNKSNIVTRTSTTTSNTTTKPNYYSKNPYFATQQKQPQQPKPKMSNSLEVLQGSIADVQKKYEILSDIVSSEANGKVHGSQSHIVNVNANNSTIVSLIVYYEVPEGQRNAIKHKFNSLVKNLMVYNSQQ